MHERQLLSFAPVAPAQWFAMPHFTFPMFTGSMADTAIFSIPIVATATVPESAAHLYQRVIMLQLGSSK